MASRNIKERRRRPASSWRIGREALAEVPIRGLRDRWARWIHPDHVYFRTHGDATADPTGSLSIWPATGKVLAATTLVRSEIHAWYSYGASSNEGGTSGRATPIQWQMITDSRRDRGDPRMTSVASATPSIPRTGCSGSIQFKMGIADSLEYLGEWDYPLRPMMAKAFSYYMSRR